MSPRILTAMVAVVLLAGAATGVALRLDRDGDDSAPLTPATELATSAPASTGGGTSSAVRVTVDPDFAGVRRRIPRDAIRPVYDPDFVSAAESPLEDSSYVMGVAIEGDARAYPVSVLNGREMVNDVVGGVPLLVTW